MVSQTNIHQEWKIWLAYVFEENNNTQNINRAVSFWAVWHYRNKLVHEGIRERISEVVKFVKAYVAELSQLEEISTTHFLQRETQWEPLEGDTIKVNFDTSYQKQLQKGIAGIVLRNNLGQIIGACAYPLNSIQDPVTVEAYACLRVVIYSKNWVSTISASKGMHSRSSQFVLRSVNKAVHEMSIWGCWCEEPRY